MSERDRRQAAAGIAAARDALGNRTVLPPAAHYARLVRHIAAAGALFHDGQRVLVVQPAHRPDQWTLPGGSTEPDQDPHTTARREVAEELGITLSPTAPLVAIDWTPAEAATSRPPLAVYVFDGGHLDANQARRQVRLQTDELLDWRYADPTDLVDLVAPHVHRRIIACLGAIDSGQAIYLHHGWRPGAARDRPAGPL